MAKKDTNEPETKSDNIVKALNLLNKKFGDGAVMTFSNATIKKVDAISTGSLGLDLALGVGGLPLGRAVEIYGPESSGKSTICMQVCAQAQKQGYNVAYLDLENAFDPVYAKNLGIDLNNMLFAQPASGEEAFQIMETLLKEKLVNVIIFDSIASARTNAELNGEVGDNFIGRQAKLMSDGLKKITPLANAANCLCIFTNQLRMKIGVMFGSPETTPGGEAMKFYASVRMRISRVIKPIEGKGEAIGNETKVKIVKNKVAPPFREAVFDILYNKGVDVDKEILDMAVKFGFIQKAGAWFKYGEEKFQGKAGVAQWLTENPKTKEKLLEDIKMALLHEPDDDNVDTVEDEIEEDVKFDPDTGEILE